METVVKHFRKFEIKIMNSFKSNEVLFKNKWNHIVYLVYARELKTLHQKFENSSIHNKITTLIFIYKATHITRLPFVFSFLSIFYVCFVTSHVASFL